MAKSFSDLIKDDIRRARSRENILSEEQKEYTVVPYAQFIRMQEELDDLRDLHALKKAKADPRNKNSRPIEDVAANLGIKLK